MLLLGTEIRLWNEIITDERESTRYSSSKGVTFSYIFLLNTLTRGDMYYLINRTEFLKERKGL